MKDIHEEVKNYYGKELTASEDLKTNACCTMEEPAEHIKTALANIHDEVMAKYYGCGLSIPSKLEGLRILDPCNHEAKRSFLAPVGATSSYFQVLLDICGNSIHHWRVHFEILS